MNDTIIQEIQDKYNEFSSSERELADFFLHNREKIDFSAQNIAKMNYVSEATVSRFSQRLGYQGYREFIFVYERFLDQEEIKFDLLTQNVLFTYKDLLNQTYSLIDEEQIRRIVLMLNNSNYVYIYGKGNSGLCAREFKMRFMRLGLHVESVVDTHLMKMNSVLMDPKSVVIAISMSGQNLVQYLEKAKERGAKTIMITALPSDKMFEVCDEVLVSASIEGLDVGNVISPQFPALVLMDIIYSHFLNKGFAKKQKLLEDTLTYIKE
ncbi:MurR/RpiR family transcriptional regulator [Erysipelothrix urinaevulpis]|uniref:MurR/RpiR family transcriptional regulator n=1 Tax=Erysipelothrix urinaevulpis TaxID=2683717 RepID=UPI00135820E0|nr:MurR/RpiR family transcriptional regulator [Erysipelothrix urinaevulpis]